MKTLNRYWWILGMQGIFLAGIGVLALIDTNIDLKSLIQYLGLVFLGFGVILTLVGLRSRKKAGPWVFSLLSGLVQVALGLAILARPAASSELFVSIIGIWALLMASLQLGLGLFSKSNKMIFIINGLVSGVFGVLILIYDFEDGRSLTSLVAIYSILLGIAIIYYSYRLRVWSGSRIRAKIESQKAAEEAEVEEEVDDMSGEDSPA